jgi:hypothetical protein
MAGNGHIRISCTGSRLVEWRKLKEFQGDLKELSKDSYCKLQASIKKHGFAAPVFVWEGHDYILDGHQRLRALAGLVDDGLDVDDKVPVVDIKAKNKKEAKELVLSYNSQYGHITEEGLYEFVQDLNWDELTKTIDIPNIDLEQFTAGYLKDEYSDSFGLPDGDKEPFQQMTFTLHDSQAELVKEALAQAKNGGIDSGVNENSNGNALAKICEAFVG